MIKVRKFVRATTTTKKRKRKKRTSEPKRILLEYHAGAQHSFKTRQKRCQKRKTEADEEDEELEVKQARGMQIGEVTGVRPLVRKNKRRKVLIKICLFL